MIQFKIWLSIIIVYAVVAEVRGKEKAVTSPPKNIKHKIDQADLGNLHWEKGEFEQAISFFEKAILRNTTLTKNVAHRFAVALHYLNRLDEAEEMYEVAMEFHKSPQLHFDYGVTLQHQGKIIEANREYNHAITLRRDFPEAWLNIAGLHHRYGSVKMAIPNYERALSSPSIKERVSTMVKMNMACALEQIGHAKESIELFTELLHAGETNVEAFDNALQLRAHIHRARQTFCSWEGFDQNFVVLLALSNAHLQRFDSTPQTEYGIIMHRGLNVVLPFDSLSMRIQPIRQRKIAELYSEKWKQGIEMHHYRPYDYERPDKLRIGYLSYDFSDHPTSHLMEGLFHSHNRDAFRISAFAYGKSNNSTYKAEIESNCDSFVNIVDKGHRESATIIVEDNVHILVDAQGHTKGARQEIVAFKPSPIIVNYLVYPGTTGFMVIDYIIADKFVAPPERSGIEFSEKVAYMPHCYQVNYYPARHITTVKQKTTTRKVWGLPEGCFVFANFNKNDKIEPVVFNVWLSILRKVPNSVLWLLRPDNEAAFDALRKNLVQEASSRGIPPFRLIFAPRVSKKEHLERASHADLFLDTFVYGAHSTATDALRGRLPVLSLEGDGFPGRVGKSLLKNVDIDILVVSSMKEFEKLAVSFAKHRERFMKLRKVLENNMDNTPLFKTETYTAELEEIYQLMWEIYVQNRTPLNIIVTS